MESPRTSNRLARKKSGDVAWKTLIPGNKRSNVEKSPLETKQPKKPRKPQATSMPSSPEAVASDHNYLQGAPDPPAEKILHKNGFDSETSMGSKANGESARVPSPYLPALPFSDPYIPENETIPDFQFGVIETLPEEQPELNVIFESQSDDSEDTEAASIPKSSTKSSAEAATSAITEMSAPRAKRKYTKRKKGEESKLPEAPPEVKKSSPVKMEIRDEDEFFLLSQVAALRRLAPQQKAWAKLKIHEVMYQAEHGDSYFEQAIITSDDGSTHFSL